MNGKTLGEVADLSDLVHARMKRIVNKRWNEMVPQTRLEITELEGHVALLNKQIDAVAAFCLKHNHSGCVPAAQLVTGQILRLLGRDEVRADEIQELITRGQQNG